MINFFRKTRKKMADDNRPLKYIRYAIGEIVLVVVGILIALSINNWNEGRINLKLEKIILIELKSDLEENLIMFKENIRTEKETLKGIDIILYHIDNKLAYNDSLGYLFQRVKHLENITVNASAYESIKSSGFKLLSSQILKMEITRLYESIYAQGVKVIEQGALGAQQSRQPIFIKYFRFVKHSDGSLWREMTTGSSIPNDYEEILNNKEIVNMISDRIGWKNAVILTNMNFIDKTEIILNKLNEVLKDH